MRVRVCKRDGCGQEVDTLMATATYSPRLKERYSELRPQLQEELGLKLDHAGAARSRRSR